MPKLRTRGRAACQPNGCSDRDSFLAYVSFDAFLGDFPVSTATSSLAEAGADPTRPLMISVALTFIDLRVNGSCPFPVRSCYPPNTRFQPSPGLYSVKESATSVVFSPKSF